MKTSFVRLVLFVVVGGSGWAQADKGADAEKARELMQRQRRGGTLTAEEQALVKRGGAERQQREAAARAAQRKAPATLTPLSDLGASDRYEGQDGGLYGGGKNTPPAPHAQAALAAAAKVMPLDATGKPARDGLIGLVAISMSNATQEFSRFKEDADASPLKSKQVTIVDLAQGGQAMAQWVPPDGRPWQVARERLAAAGVSAQQVQVAWVKLANVMPTGSLEEHGRKLERDTLAVLHHARRMFPHLRIVYLGSRTYAGYASTVLNPEPYAYESAFPVRWLIQRQMKGDPALALDKTPLLLWGPYLWADGTKGRKGDGVKWERADFVGDGVHPSPSGRKKVSDLLMAFFTTDPTAKAWFVARAGSRAAEGR